MNHFNSAIFILKVLNLSHFATLLSFRINTHAETLQMPISTLAVKLFLFVTQYNISLSLDPHVKKLIFHSTTPG